MSACMTELSLEGNMVRRWSRGLVRRRRGGCRKFSKMNCASESDITRPTHYIIAFRLTATVPADARGGTCHHTGHFRRDLAFHTRSCYCNDSIVFVFQAFLFDFAFVRKRPRLGTAFLLSLGGRSRSTFLRQLCPPLPAVRRRDAAFSTAYPFRPAWCATRYQQSFCYLFFAVGCRQGLRRTSG